LNTKVEQPAPVYPIHYDSLEEWALSYYAAALKSMDEPGICAAQARFEGLESYRFLWMRSFHRPILIEVTFSSNSDVRAVYKELDGAGGYELGQLAKVLTIDVDELLLQEVEDAELVEAIVESIRETSQIQFWDLSSRVDNGSIRLDGANWLVEGVRGGKCHLVERWSPSPGEELRTFAEQLIRLSGQQFLYDEVY
jgi:hypothetical protein